MNVMELSERDFKSLLDSKAAPSDMYEAAKDIYGYLAGIFEQNCFDSMLREWAFQWYSDKTNQDYAVIYDAWLSN